MCGFKENNLKWHFGDKWEHFQKNCLVGLYEIFANALWCF